MVTPVDQGLVQCQCEHQKGMMELKIEIQKMSETVAKMQELLNRCIEEGLFRPYDHSPPPYGMFN